MQDLSTNPDPPVLLEIEAGIATVTLNRPKSINALSEEMLAALQETWDGLATNRDVKVVILRGAGDHFCAGHNLKEMTARREDADGGHQYFNDLFSTCSKMMLSMVNLPQPVIAEVTGIATAAGCQLVATCDLAVASDTARFATSGVNIGLFCSTPMVALSRAVPRKAAMEMLLLGEFVEAEKAAQYGLINRVVPLDKVSDTTREMAENIVGKSPVAVKMGKGAFYQQAEMELAEAYEFAGRTMAENMMARDAERGIGAFVTKKPMPEWTGE
ncbi:enoyl-CoA hydratase [Actibacterium pelagium]|uniref:enoyl-CoA hydratase n=1 Tax=Actibacterium pelagium TaxID=2029103 RepID=UPI000BAAC824|nr:enoyl-CoA hydratase [Actibacterium pelagium]